jgi:hypothetical protein
MKNLNKTKEKRKEKESDGDFPLWRRRWSSSTCAVRHFLQWPLVQLHHYSYFAFLKIFSLKYVETPRQGIWTNLRLRFIVERHFSIHIFEYLVDWRPFVWKSTLDGVDPRDRGSGKTSSQRRGGGTHTHKTRHTRPNKKTKN